MTLAGPAGTRELDAGDFFVTDGIWNTRRASDEILTGIRIPLNGVVCRNRAVRRSAYRKLRQRNSIDFPLLSVAVVGDFEEDGTMAGLTGVVSALGARPRVLAGWDEIAVGERLGPEVMAMRWRSGRGAQCRPLDNIIVDTEWRRAMVPVQVRRALGDLAGG